MNKEARTPRTCAPFPKAHGAGAYLDHIPDPDLRLLAQIELAAALAGLPEWQGIQQFRRRPRGRTPMPGIRCPRCQWQPSKEDRWGCRCGHAWNTFETRGRCPACQYQWETTACLACRERSPHADWYAPQ